MKTSPSVETITEYRSAARKAHFAAGLSPKQWRGNARSFRDRKHAANKNACRGQNRQSA